MIRREEVNILPPNVVLLDVAGPRDAFRNTSNLVPGSYALRFGKAPRERIPSAVGLSLAALEPLPAALARGACQVLAGIGGGGAGRPSRRRAR